MRFGQSFCYSDQSEGEEFRRTNTISFGSRRRAALHNNEDPDLFRRHPAHRQSLPGQEF